MNAESYQDDGITIFKRFLDKIRNHLVLQVIRNQLAKFGIDFMPFYLTQVKLDETKAQEIKDDDPSAYKVGLLAINDIKVVGNNSRGYSEDLFLEFLKRGNFCICVRHHDKIVSIVWFDINECNFNHQRFTLKKNEAYSFSLYTVESYRGKNIAAYLLYQSYQMLKEKGIDTFYGISEYFNHSARRYKKKLNARNMKLILHVSLFRKFQLNMTLKTYK